MVARIRSAKKGVFPRKTKIPKIAPNKPVPIQDYSEIIPLDKDHSKIIPLDKNKPKRNQIKSLLDVIDTREPILEEKENINLNQDIYKAVFDLASKLKEAQENGDKILSYTSSEVVSVKEFQKPSFFAKEISKILKINNLNYSDKDIQKCFQKTDNCQKNNKLQRIFQSSRIEI